MFLEEWDNEGEHDTKENNVGGKTELCFNSYNLRILFLVHGNVISPIKWATNAIHAESSVMSSDVTSNDASLKNTQQMFTVPIDKILRRS